MAAKRGIHGLRFPVGNPKTLEVVYTTLEKMLSLRDEHSAEPRRSVQYVCYRREGGFELIAYVLLICFSFVTLRCFG